MDSAPVRARLPRELRQLVEGSLACDLVGKRPPPVAHIPFQLEGPQMKMTGALIDGHSTKDEGEVEQEALR